MRCSRLFIVTENWKSNTARNLLSLARETGPDPAGVEDRIPSLTELTKVARMWAGC